VTSLTNCGSEILIDMAPPSLDLKYLDIKRLPPKILDVK